MEGLPWLHHAHSATRVVVHMVWATYRRVPLLSEGLDGRLATLVSDKCGELGCRCVAVGNADDHVHALVIVAATISVASLAHRLKGATSRILGLQLAEPFAWQEGYFAESVADVGAVATYILNQREHHRSGATADAWELVDGPREPSAE